MNLRNMKDNKEIFALKNLCRNFYKIVRRRRFHCFQIFKRKKTQFKLGWHDVLMTQLGAKYCRDWSREIHRLMSK